ncbi:MAG: type II toxin-antitoxin system VapC family toxin [Thermoproteota archaeon]
MEELKKVVLDASVVVKWFVPEAYYEKALTIRRAFLNGRIKLAEPSLLIYEVANALRFHKIYKLSEDDMVEAVRAILAFRMLEKVKREDWRKTLELSMSREVSIYDAIYAALAIRLEATLITSDAETKKKLGDQASIVLLKDL